MRHHVIAWRTSPSDLRPFVRFTALPALRRLQLASLFGPVVGDVASTCSSRRPSLYPAPVLALRAFSSVTGLALLASRIVCLIVIAWFVMFAVGQSKAASTSQTNKVAVATQQSTVVEAPAHQSSAKKTLDDIAKAVTSPFKSLISSSSSAWLQHGEDTLLALLVYGVGVGFLARIVRLRI